MSILNLGLYNVAAERPLIDQTDFPGMEARFRSLKNMADLRAYGKRYPLLAEGLHRALEPVMNLFYDRFERLQLKGQGFLRGEGVTEQEADAFFETIKQLLSPAEQRLQRGDIKRQHLASAKLKRFMDTHMDVDPYKLEVDKKCWRNRFLALRNECGGELPNDKVAEVLATFKCEFGCPPPVTPICVFIDMHPVPRPKVVVGGRYDTFENTYGTYGTPTPVDLPPLKGEINNEEIAPSGVLEKKNVQGVVRCVGCLRFRCVYAKTQLSRSKAFDGATATLADVLVDMLDANSYVPLRSIRSVVKDRYVSGCRGTADARHPSNVQLRQQGGCRRSGVFV